MWSSNTKKAGLCCATDSWAGSICSDLPFDGCPEQRYIQNEAGLKLNLYRWKRGKAFDDAAETRLRGVIVLLHGVRAHARLTWLAKRPVDMAEAVTPRDVVRRYMGITTPVAGREEMMVEGKEDIVMSPAHSMVTTASTGDLATSDSFYCSDSHCDGPSEEDRSREVFYEASWIEALNVAGFEVIAADLQGHGRSEGDRCNVKDFQDYVDDLYLVLNDVVRRDYPVPLPLIVCGVSMSTLVVCKLLQESRCKALDIRACCLFSSFLKEGGRYSRFPLRNAMTLLSALRNILPKVPVIIPKRPETEGPSWQLKYGYHDPYLVTTPFTIRMIGTCIHAFQTFSRTVTKIKEQLACRHIQAFHNYEDPVNPCDSSSMEPLAWMMQNVSDIDIGCHVFNYPTPGGDAGSDAGMTRSSGGAHDLDALLPRTGQFIIQCDLNSVDSSKLQRVRDVLHKWRQFLHREPAVEVRLPTNIVLDTRRLDLSHTLITDRDNVVIFEEFYKWLNRVAD